MPKPSKQEPNVGCSADRVDLLIGTMMNGIKAGLVQLQDDTIRGAIGQQLENGGLLQHLPRILTASAQQMNTFDWSATSGTTLEDVYTTNLQLFDPAVQPQQDWWLLSAVLFGLELLWPLQEVPHKVQPVLAPAVLQFFLQAMQSVSQSIDSLRAGTQEPPDLLRLTVQNVCKAAADAVAWGAELPLLR
jgi:hypothetical protein